MEEITLKGVVCPEAANGSTCRKNAIISVLQPMYPNGIDQVSCSYD